MNKKTKQSQFGDPLDLFPRTLTKLYSTWLARTYPFASIGKKVSFHFTSKVCRPRSSRISLGDGVSLREYAWLNVATEDPSGEPVIVIENNSHVGFATILSARNRIHVEQNVLIGQHVIIVDHNHSYEDVTMPIIDQGINEGGRVRIGEGTWIGHGAAIICPRGALTIGHHCVIAVNSVVMRSIPPYSVVAGYPATVIRQYDPETGSWRIGRRETKATDGVNDAGADVTMARAAVEFAHRTSHNGV